MENLAKKETDPNPPYGEKGDFRKITITLPLSAYEKLMQESVRRKIAGEPNRLLSAMIREAASSYFEGSPEFAGGDKGMDTQ
jgi:transcriptional regulator of met regulon